MFQVSYYQASASQALVIQTDTSADAWGYLLKQQLPLADSRATTYFAEFLAPDSREAGGPLVAREIALYNWR